VKKLIFKLIIACIFIISTSHKSKIRKPKGSYKYKDITWSAKLVFKKKSLVVIKRGITSHSTIKTKAKGSWKYVHHPVRPLILIDVKNLNIDTLYMELNGDLSPTWDTYNKSRILFTNNKSN
jgi:hypothetical protein